MRIGIERIQAERLAVATLRFREAPQVVVDVAEIEVRLEEVGLETDRALVERLGLDQLVVAVMDVRQVDERRDQVRIELERLAIGGGRLFLPIRPAVVER